MAPPAASSLTVTYAQPVNNSPNVIVASVNVNILAVMSGDATDYQSYVSTILVRGLWVGLQFIPASWISLVTINQ